MTSRLAVCSASDVSPREMRAFVVDGNAILVLNASDGFVACSGMCPHQEVPLCDGIFDGEVLTCTEHLWQWTVCNGEPLGAAEKPLELFRTEVVDGKVYVEVT